MYYKKIRALFYTYYQLYNQPAKLSREFAYE